MAIIIQSIDIISLITILIILGTLLVAYLKKWMMTLSLIIANFIVFILTLVFTINIQNFGNISIILLDLSFRPEYLSFEKFPQLYTLFTSMFIHADFLHIIGNMFVFFFIGMAFEHRVGGKKFIIIYLISGICGTMAHSLLNLNSSIPLVGASGAIFGIMGAYAFSYPRDEVVMPIPVGFFMILRRIKVIYAVLIFAAIETVIVLIGYQDNTAHFAHLGGLVGGVLLASILIRGKKSINANGKQIYYDTMTNENYFDFDISKLRELASTEDENKILDKIENETLPQVKKLWIDHFFEKIKCPNCDNPLNYSKNSVFCKKCGYKNNI
jgi:membrane associated rhomboid family serine protease